MANNVLPVLRFAEYEEDWQPKKLKTLGEFIGGGTPDTSVKDYWNGSIPWISSSDLIEGSIHEINKTRFITKDAINSSATKLVPKGCILMVSRVGIGKFAVADENLCTSQDFTNLISTQNEYFLCYYFKARSNRFVRLSQGTSIKGFTTKDIKSANFLIPSLLEQAKIANFLTAIDKRIKILEKKKTDLEQYKKGVMQKLFARTIRFKKDDGSDFPDWEEKKLDELGETFNGLTGKTKVDFGEGKPYIQYMQIFSNSQIDTSQFGLVKIEDGENQSIAQVGDVFFTTSSETPNEIGTSSVLTVQVDEVYLNSFCFGYRPNSLDELVPVFSQFFFRSENVRRKVIKLAQGSTRFNMSKLELMKLKFDFPKKDEQVKIANFLISIDKSIEKVGAQIEDSILFKQGLLQKMFV
jgi:type I restriction enzyme S subunit